MMKRILRFLRHLPGYLCENPDLRLLENLYLHGANEGGRSPKKQEIIDLESRYNTS